MSDELFWQEQWVGGDATLIGAAGIREYRIASVTPGLDDDGNYSLAVRIESRDTFTAATSRPTAAQDGQSGTRTPPGASGASEGDE